VANTGIQFVIANLTSAESAVGVLVQAKDFMYLEYPKKYAIVIHQN